MAEPIITLLENWDETHTLTRDEAIAILELPDEQLPQLIETAYVLRTKYKGKKVSIQLLTNVRSGNCSQNCAYCAQSCESKAPIEKYRRVSDEKLYGDNDLVDEKHLARHCIGLSGIRFTDAEIEDLAARIRKMKKNDTQICCSIGFLTEKQAEITAALGLTPGCFVGVTAGKKLAAQKTAGVLRAKLGKKPEQAEEWRSAVAAAFPGYDVTYDPLSLSVSCHIGPGGLGIGVSRIIL